MRPKSVKASATETSRLMLPTDANQRGYVHGGVIMHLMDEAAGTVAIRHSQRPCVTASIDRMNFFAPVYVGNLLILKASVNFVGKTSLEIGVKIEAEDMMTGKRVHTNSSYLVYVALDDDGRPTSVPRVVPESKAEKRRYKEGRERRRVRLEVLRGLGNSRGG